MAAGDVGCPTSRGSRTARPWRRIPVGCLEKPTVTYLFARWLPRVDRARPGRRYPARTDRRHRRALAVLVQLGARQAHRHRTGQVARDPVATGIGEPEP